LIVPSLPVTPEPAEGVAPSATVSAGQMVLHWPVQALLPLSFTSCVNV
jgi:hypothetical protein